MMDWHRKRHPDDVPTPVAVAVSDFCRRARVPAPPALVRDALAGKDAGTAVGSVSAGVSADGARLVASANVFRLPGP
jgi:hypothetical protein